MGLQLRCWSLLMGADDGEATLSSPRRASGPKPWKPPDQKILPVQGTSNLRNPRAGYPLYRHAVGGHMGVARADSVAGESEASRIAYGNYAKTTSTSKRPYGTGIPAKGTGRSGKLSSRSSESSSSSLYKKPSPNDQMTVGGIKRPTKGPAQDTGRWERLQSPRDSHSTITSGPMLGTTIQLPPPNQIKTTSLNLALDPPSSRSSEAGYFRQTKAETPYRSYAALPISPRREADPAAPGPGFIRTRLGGYYAREKFIQP